jgi:hypothetical protein
MRQFKSSVQFSVIVGIVFLISGSVVGQNAVPMLINYQGELRSPITEELAPDGAYNMVFRFHDVASGGIPLWQGTHSDVNGNPVPIRNGAFSVILGSGAGNALDTSVFAKRSDVWLEITIEKETLKPRQRMTSTAYSMVSENSRLLGGKEPSDFVIQALGFRLETNATSPNIIAGHGDNAVTAGSVGATIAGGGLDGNANSVTDSYGTVGGGRGNRAGNNTGTTDDADYATVCGGWYNDAGNVYATVGGGYSNVASANSATVGGGWNSSASADYATVGGGYANNASSDYATVGGGRHNAASGSYATISGGYNNEATADFATIAGGGPDPGHPSTTRNVVTDEYGTIGGGGNNQAGNNMGTTTDAGYATVAGGHSNTASGYYATVGGGWSNAANGEGATVPGGWGNTANGSNATIGGGWSNDASGYGATVAGGELNTASDGYATVAGGHNNTADGGDATVGGGSGNIASGIRATVSGGYDNTASAHSATVGGGYSNTASGEYATVGGGRLNRCDASYGTVAGGGPANLDNPSATSNRVTDNYGTVGGGGNNQAGDNAGTTSDASYATVAGGLSNDASETYATVGGGMRNEASGFGATIPGGTDNAAEGDYSFAAGHAANANHNGCFVWCDSQVGSVASTNTDQFIARASGGVWFYSNAALSAGVKLNPGAGSWSSVSDRALKENIITVDGKGVLRKLMAVPMARWNYKAQDSRIRHMGPMAQDFYAAFGLGEDDKHISTVDADGVALAAIQGLHEIVREKDEKVSSLEKKNADLESRLVALEELVEKLTDHQGEQQ